MWRHWSKSSLSSPLSLELRGTKHTILQTRPSPNWKVVDIPVYTTNMDICVFNLDK